MFKPSALAFGNRGTAARHLPSLPGNVEALRHLGLRFSNSQRDRVEHFRLRFGSRLKRMRVRCENVLNPIAESEAAFDIQTV